jgi:hypothetical protein
MEVISGISVKSDSITHIFEKSSEKIFQNAEWCNQFQENPQSNWTVCRLILVTEYECMELDVHTLSH